MTLQSTTRLRGSLLLLALGVAPLAAQVTTINVNSNLVQTGIKRFGINLGYQAFFDSGQLLKNLVFTNPSFEGQIYQSTIRCSTGTATSCTDENPYSGFTTNFWRTASYEMITGSSKGRSGSICSFSGGAYPVNGGIYSFCDSGTVPAQGDYMVLKITMPANTGWPGGDWQTVVGAGALTAETSDLPPGTTGKQAALLTAPGAGDVIGVNMFFDTTAGKTFVQLNGSYQLTFKAKGLSGSKSLAIKLDRATAGLTYINTTQVLSSSWATYTMNFNASESGTAIGNVKLAFTTTGGADVVELDDVSLVKTSVDPTNTTVFRDEVVNALQALHPGVLRFWEDQLAESLDNLLADPQGRQRSGYTPYNGFDGTDFYFQTQTVKFGLTDFLQLCQKVGADPWIVVPSTFSTGEAYNLIDYLSGPANTTYGAKRAATGQSQPWSSVFHQIHLEFGNEAWNGGTFKGGSIEYGDSYGGRATAIFAAVKGNPAYVAASYNLIVNGQSAAPFRNQNIQSYALNNDSFSLAPYMMYNITSWDTPDHLFGTTFAEAEAFVTANASAEGVNGGYITIEQQLVGKPIVSSEMNLGNSNGTITQAVLDGYASSVGGGIAVLDSMFQQLRAGVLTQNLFSLGGYIAATAQSPYNLVYLWGSVVDMGASNRVRPQYLALQLANSAIGNSTQELQTTHTGSDPTDNQYNFGLNTVSLPTFHLLQSFAFNGSGTTSLVVFNVSPDFAVQVNFGGPNAPTGTVTMQRLTSANITDTNEFANNVQTTSQVLSNFNASANMSLPPYSMTVFTWGGSGTNVSVPFVVGLTQAAANSLILNVGLTVGTVTTASSATVPAGSVISQSPASATSVSAGSAVNLTVSTGSGQVTVPNVVGSTQAAATTAITGAGLVLGTVTTASSATVAIGIVISETPAAATSVNPGSAVNLVISGGTTVPNVVGSTQAAATTAITGAGLVLGTVTTASSATVPSGSVISESPAAGTAVNGGSAVNLIVSSGSGQVNVPNVVGSTQAAATTAITGAGLVVGTVTTASSTTVAIGNVISESPAAATSVNSGSAVNLVISSGTTVPNVVGSTQAAATTAITGAGLVVGTVTTAPSGTVPAGSVISESPATGTAVNGGSAVNLTVSSGPGQVAVPNVVALTQAAATTSITGAGLVVGTVTSASSNTVAIGKVISQSPAAATSVNAGSAVNLVISTGTTVPNVVGTTQAAATTAITGAGLVVGTVTTASSTTVAIGNVISESPAAGTAASGGAPVALVISSGTTVPNVVNSTQAAATTAITTAGLTVGTVTTASSTTVAIGNVISESPAAATAVNGGTAVALVISSGTTVPNVVNLTQAAATTAITTAGLTVGTVTTAASVTVPVGSVISESPAAGMAASGGTAVNLVISGGATVPNVVGLTQAAATTAITSTGLTVGTVTTATSTTVAIGKVISSSPAAGTAVSGGSAVALVISSGTTVPNVVNSTQAAATTTITTAGLTVGTVTTSPSTTVPVGSVISESPAAGTAASGGSAVNLVVSGGTPVPSVVGLTQAAATTSITGAALTVGTITTASSITVATGNVISSSPAAGTAVSGGSPVALVISSGTAVPAVVGLTQAAATTAITGAGLTVGTVTTAASTTVAIGNVLSSSPAAATAVNPGTAVALVISSGTTVPNVVGSTQTAAATAITGAGLTVGTVTTQVSSTVAAGTVISEAPAAGTAASGGSAVNLVVSSGTAPPPVLSSVASYPVADTTASMLWTTDQNATSQVKYGLTNSYGSVTTLNPALGLYHVVPLTGLNAGTTYHYQVISTNSAGATATSADYSFTTTGTAPLLFTAVTATAITATSATITWTTDKASTSQVAYGQTTNYGAYSAPNSALVTSHSVTLTGLTPGTPYNYLALSTNAAYPTGASTNFTFATTGATAPVISGVTTTAITNTSATVNWTTDQPATTQLSYGATTGYGLLSQLAAGLVTSHSVTLTSLTPGTTYNFTPLSVGSTGVAAVPAGNFVLATTNTATPPPVITNVAAWPVGDTTASILWTTDVGATSQVKYGLSNAYGSQSTPDNTLAFYHVVPLTGLTPGTTYHFQVTSLNAAAVPGSSTDFSFTTSGTAPALQFTGVTATAITTTTATINWTTNQAASTQVAYGTTAGYGSQSLVNSSLVTTHSVNLTGLAANTTYNYAALSTNAASPAGTSGNFTFKTAAGGGSAPVISGVTATAITNTSATITWTTDQGASTQVAYGTTVGYGAQSVIDNNLLTTHTVTLNGLTSGTTYNYSPASANGFGSAPSVNYSFATTSSSTPAPVITNVASWPVADTTASILWTTDQPATSLVKYGTTPALGSQTTINNSTDFYHVVPLTGLTPGTTYYFSVVTTNGSGVTATSTNSSFNTSGIAPAAGPVISGVTVTAITTTSATINWTTDQPSSTQVSYGTTTTYGSLSLFNNALTTSHSVTLTGLGSGTAYNFAPLSTNISGTSSGIVNHTFATTGVAGPPVISAVSAGGVNSTSATITWTTDQPASTQVSYGTTTAYTLQSPLIATLVTAHSVTLNGLAPGTLYDYSPLSSNGQGAAPSTNFTFTTSSAVAGPTVTNVTVWGITGSGAVVTWSTDQLADTAVEYGTTTGLGQTSPVQSALSASHGVTLTGLQGNTTYYVRGKSTNSGGGVGYSTIFSFTTLDTAGPVLTNIAATPGIGNTATISWTVSKPATTQVEYGLNSTSYGWWSPQSTGTSTALGWVPSGTIHYRIHSVDASGNQTVSGDFTFVEP